MFYITGERAPKVAVPRAVALYLCHSPSVQGGVPMSLNVFRDQWGRDRGPTDWSSPGMFHTDTGTLCLYSLVLLSEPCDSSGKGVSYRQLRFFQASIWFWKILSDSMLLLPVVSTLIHGRLRGRVGLAFSPILGCSSKGNCITCAWEMLTALLLLFLCGGAGSWPWTCPNRCPSSARVCSCPERVGNVMCGVSLLPSPSTCCEAWGKSLDCSGSLFPPL